jgi:hypothetical protein
VLHCGSNSCTATCAAGTSDGDRPTLADCNNSCGCSCGCSPSCP